MFQLSSLLTGKIPTADSLKKLFFSILQSSCFLCANGTLYIVFFCLLRYTLACTYLVNVLMTIFYCYNYRKMFGNFGFFSISFLPSLFANILGILIEKPSRRPPIAVYVTNVVCCIHMCCMNHGV